ncbi:hypothetical protein EDD86DRAFT_209625 [Gorgonomyces haynaldii]|nr:hypothetical protein EDD86DRAFT_209625 [Gorgonomyces haynaldii]
MAHLEQVEQKDKAIQYLVDPLVSKENHEDKLTILTRLFGIYKKYAVFLAILKLTQLSEEPDWIVSVVDDLVSWIKEWHLTPKQERDTFVQVGKVIQNEAPLKAYEFQLRAIKTIQKQDFDKEKELLFEAVRQAVTVPQVLNFDEIVGLSAIQSLGPQTVSLLKLFVSGSMQDYREYVKKNKDFLSKHGLPEQDVEFKVRILSLAELASNHMHKELSYDQIAKKLDIDLTQVEFWVIHAVRAKLIDLKMNQQTQTLFVSRSTFRTFSKNEWQALDNVLGEWQINLKQCLALLQ